MMRVLNRASVVSIAVGIFAALTAPARAETGTVVDINGAPPTYIGTRSCVASPITSRIDGISGQATVNDDGSRAVFWSTADYNGDNPDHNLEVFVAMLDGGVSLKYTQITSSTGSVLGGFNLAPAISSDGRSVAFFSDRDLTGQNSDGNFEIFVADVSGIVSVNSSGPVPIRQVTNSAIGININPSISSDGRYIAFASDRDYTGGNADANSEIFRAELRNDGGINMVQVTNTGADVNNDFPAISASGRQVAYATNSNAAGSTSAGVYHADIAPNGSANVTQIALFNSQTSNQIAISADGSRVAYASNQADPNSPTTQVFLASVASGSAQIQQVTTLSNTNGASNSQPGLNADASRMVWVTTQGITSAVMMYEPATGVLERLSNSSENAAPRFTASGLGLVYAANLEAVFGDCSASDLSLDVANIAPTPLLAGGRYTQTIRVSNLGPGWMKGVVLTATVPSGAYDIQGSVALGSCTNGTGTQPSVCTIGTMQKNEVLLATFGFTVSPTQELPLVNTIVANALTIDRYTPNNTVTATASVDGPADLRMFSRVTPSSVVAGDLLTYTYDITNVGPLHSNGGVVTFTFSPDVSVLGYPSPCVLSGPYLSCEFGLLQNNNSLSYTVSTRVSPLARSAITNTALVVGKYDIDTSNDRASLVTPVSVSADLNVSLGSVTSTVYVGDVVTFTARVTNTGPSAARGVVITQALPSGLIWNSGTATGGSCLLSGSNIICPAGTIMPGNSAVATLSATVTSWLGAQRVTTVTTGGIDPDPNSANNSATLNVLLNPVDLQLTQTGSSGAIRAGELLTYSLQVTNLNTVGNASQVHLTVTLPASTSVVSAPPSCSVSAGQMLCSISILPPQASQSYALAVRVDPLYRGATILSTAVVDSEQIEAINAANNNTSVSTSVSTRVALSITQSLAATDLYVGGSADVVVRVVNDGPSAATGLVITDVVPAGLSLSNADGASCDAATGTVRCAVATLDAGAQAMITLTLQAQNELGAAVTHTLRIAGNEPETNLADNVASLALRLNPIDLSIQQSAAGSFVAGTRMTYTHLIRNLNPVGDATQVRISQTLPGGVSVALSTPGCGTSAPVLTCTLSSLTAGASRSITVVVDLPPTLRGSLISTATVSSDQLETSPANNTNTLNLSIDAQADLSVQHSMTSSLLFNGDQFTLDLVVTNSGPSLVNHVLLTETLPAGVTMLSYTHSPALTCSGSAPVLCSANSLAANATLTAALRLQVSTSRTDSVSLVLDGSADEPDAVPGNNQDTLTAVMNRVDLAVAHLNPPASAVAGSMITYTLRITNLNTLGSATQLRLTDTLPANVQYVSATSGCAAASGTVTCTLGTLAPQATRDVIITSTVNAAARGSLTNSVSVGSAQLDPSSADNADSAVTAISTSFDLSVNQKLARTQLFDNDTTALVITLTNSGPSTARNLALTETLPAGLTATGYTASTGVSCTIASAQCGASALGAGQSLTVSFAISVSTPASGDVPLILAAAADEPEVNTANNTLTISATLNTLDLRVSQSNSAPVSAGQPVTYTLFVTNASSGGAATQVVLTDTLPAQTTFASGPGRCAAGAGVVTCTLGTLAPNGATSVTLVLNVDSAARGTLTNDVAVAGAQFDPNTSNNSSSASAAITARADLSLLTSLSATALSDGDTPYLVMTLTNAGPAAASGIKVTTTLPGGLTTSDYSDSVMSCVGTPAVCTFGALAANGTVTAQLMLTTTPSGTGAAVVTSTVGGAEPDANLANNTRTINVVLNQIDMAIDHINVDTALVAGDPVTYTLLITNTDPDGTATLVRVTDTLPARITYAGSSGGCSFSSSQVVCSLGTMPPLSNRTITITGAVNGRTSATITNTAVVAAAQFDPVSGNNTSQSSAGVIVADLALTQSIGAPTLFTGDVTALSITATNVGGGRANAPTLTETLPSGLVAVGYSASAGTTCTGIPTPVVVCSKSTRLDPGLSMTVSLRISVTVAAQGALSIAGSVGTSTSEFTNTNNSQVTPVTANQVDLAAQFVQSTPAVAGAPVTYTLRITNLNAIGSATQITLVNTIPVSATFSSASSGCSAVGQSVTCLVASLAPGAGTPITIAEAIDAFANPAQPFVNSASVASAQLDTDSANNSAAITSTLTQLANLNLASSLSGNVLRTGEVASLLLTVTNGGPSGATGATAVITIPSALGASVVGQSAGVSCAGSPISCALPTLAGGSSVTVSLAISPQATGGGLASITLGAQAAQPDPDLANNARTHSVTVDQADLSLGAIAPISSVVVGTPVTYTWRITNLNAVGSATQVKLTDTVTGGMTFITGTVGCADSAGAVVCALGNLAALASQDISMTFMVSPTASGTVTSSLVVGLAQSDPNPGNNSLTLTTPVTGSAPVSQIDLALGAVAPISSVVAGTPVTYTWRITNLNTAGTATQVRLTDTVTGGLTFVTGTVGCAGNAGVVVCALSDLAGLASQDVSMTFLVSPTASGAVTSSLVVGLAQTDPNLGNNSLTLTTTVTASAPVQIDLALGAVAPVNSVMAGTPVTYTWRITNLNTVGTANQLRLTDTVAGGMTFITGTVGCADNAGAVACVLSDLAAQASQDVSMTFLVSPTARGVVTSSVVVGLAQTDPNLGDNSLALSTPVTASAPLTVAISGAPAVITTSEPLTLTFVVTNLGPSSASNVVLTNTLPLTVSLLYFTPAACVRTDTVSTADFTCALGSLSPNAAATVQITGTVSAIPSGTLAITSTVSADEPPNLPANPATATYSQ